MHLASQAFVELRLCILVLVAFTAVKTWWEGGVEITGYEAGERGTRR